jgi:hypothetical protein
MKFSSLYRVVEQERVVEIVRMIIKRRVRLCLYQDGRRCSALRNCP